jgi:hypothetical protein
MLKHVDDTEITNECIENLFVFARDANVRIQWSVMRYITLALSAMLVTLLGFATRAEAETVEVPLPGPDYVMAPGAWMHRSCVLQIPDGATVIEEKDGSLRAELDGREVARQPPCGYPGYPLHTDSTKTDLKSIAIMPAKGDGCGGDDAPVPSVNGWLEQSWLDAPTSPWGTAWWNSMSSVWTVPSAPATMSTQTLFYFNGMEPPDYSRIIQPVLQWGTSAAGGETLGHRKL